jgi:hypothetical protein
MIDDCYTGAVYSACIKSLCISSVVIISYGTVALFTWVAVNTNNNESVARRRDLLHHHHFIFTPAQWILHCGPLPPRPTPEAAAAELVAADPLPKLLSHLDP